MLAILKMLMMNLMLWEDVRESAGEQKEKKKKNPMMTFDKAFSRVWWSEDDGVA